MNNHSLSPPPSKKLRKQAAWIQAAFPYVFIALLLRRRWVFIAQKSVWRLVFLDFRETAYWRLEAVVGIVIVTLADFSDQDCACSRFHFKIMVHSSGITVFLGIIFLLLTAVINLTAYFVNKDIYLSKNN